MMIVRLSAQRAFEAFALSQLNSFIVQGFERFAQKRSAPE